MKILFGQSQIMIKALSCLLVLGLTSRDLVLFGDERRVQIMTWGLNLVTLDLRIQRGFFDAQHSRGAGLITVGFIQSRANQINLEPLNFVVQSNLASGGRRSAPERFQFGQKRECDFSQSVEAGVQHVLGLSRRNLRTSW